MISIRKLSTLLLSCLSVLGAACMISPRNGEQVGSAEGKVSFVGFVPGNNAPVKVEALDRSGAWRLVGPVVSSAANHSYIEPGGTHWYEWRLAACLGPEFWRYDRASGRQIAKVRSGAPNSSVSFTSFDVNKDACFNEHGAGNPSRYACASAQSPVATISAPLGFYDWGKSECCGGQWQAPCVNGACKAGLFPNWITSSSAHLCDAGCGHGPRSGDPLPQPACRERYAGPSGPMFRFRCLDSSVLTSDGAGCLCMPNSRYTGPDISDDSGTCVSAIDPGGPGDADDPD